MDVPVLPMEYLLHVLEPAGLNTDPSSKLVRLDATVELGYSLGLDRVFETQRLPTLRKSFWDRPR